MSDRGPALHKPVSFTIHCDIESRHTLSLSALGSIILSHHEHPETEWTLLQLGGESRMPQCLRWWRALQGNEALRERMYLLAIRGINPLDEISVVEHEDGSITWKERPPHDKGLTMEALEWHIERWRQSGVGP